MNRISRRFPSAAAFSALALLAQSGWTTYSSHEYGFSMLVPQGTHMQEKEFGDGWGGAYCEHDGVEFVGIAKMGKESEADIIGFGVETTEIEEKYWKQVDQGQGYKVFRAQDGDHVVLAAVAVGSKASFLLFLKTTQSDINRHKADYEKWYKSVTIK